MNTEQICRRTQARPAAFLPSCEVSAPVKMEKKTKKFELYLWKAENIHKNAAGYLVIFALARFLRNGYNTVTKRLQSHQKTVANLTPFFVVKENRI